MAIRTLRCIFQALLWAPASPPQKRQKRYTLSEQVTIERVVTSHRATAKGSAVAKGNGAID